MTDAPEADVRVDAALARRLVAAQHPDLEGPIELVASGWDNVVFRLGGEHSIRMPRRRIAVPLLEHEQEWLPRLAPMLPVPVPAPLRLGAPSEEYPFPWSITPWFRGIPAWSLSPADRAPLARPLAGFLAALHAPAPADAPRNPVRGVPLAERDEVVRRRLAGDRVPHGDRLLGLWDAALAAPVWVGAPVWVHGDPHPGNVIVAGAASPSAWIGEDGPAGAARLVAVVDFGDVTAGDPASDLAVAWMAFDAGGRRAFREALEGAGAVDAAMWARARGWAAGIAGAMFETVSGRGPVARMAEHTVRELLGGD